jgi:hypothetical protein
MKKQEQQTQTGGLHDSVGFPGFKEEGYVQSLEEQLQAMEANGLTVERTPEGILVTPKTN